MLTIALAPSISASMRLSNSMTEACGNALAGPDPLALVARHEGPSTRSSGRCSSG
jgi:hypothetical protein